MTGRQIEDVADEAPGWSSKTGRITKKKREKAAGPVHAVRNSPKASLSGLARMGGVKAAALPAFVEPSLATLVANAPAGKRWLHEIKFDGYRLQVRIDQDDVRFTTRGVSIGQKVWGDASGSHEGTPSSAALIDGELVVENGSGASDFSALQTDLSEGRSERFVFTPSISCILMVAICAPSPY